MLQRREKGHSSTQNSVISVISVRMQISKCNISYNHLKRKPKRNNWIAITSRVKIRGNCLDMQAYFYQISRYEGSRDEDRGNRSRHGEKDHRCCGWIINHTGHERCPYPQNGWKRRSCKTARRERISGLFVIPTYMGRWGAKKAGMYIHEFHDLKPNCYRSLK